LDSPRHDHDLAGVGNGRLNLVAYPVCHGLHITPDGLSLAIFKTLTLFL
jgi:hypothetical protein